MTEKIPVKMINKFDEEYKNIINPILNNKEFLKRKEYHHHNNRSVYYHSLMVSFRSYKISKFLRLNYIDSAIGGLLHDFYYNDWQLSNEHKPLYQAHGFVHAKEALENSKKFFPELINKKTENIIKHHMFPLTFIPPLYLESWIICMVDKYCSLEIFKSPRELYKYVGIRKKRDDLNE